MAAKPKPGFAQAVRMWTTTVELLKSKGEIEQFLESDKVGADQIIAFYDKETRTLKVRFRLNGRVYLIEKRPLPVDIEAEPRSEWRKPEWQAKKDKLDAQAVRQMGRLAKAHIELIISMVAEGHTEMLDVYQLTPGGGPTFQQMRPEGLMELLQNADCLALPARSEFEEVAG